MRRFFTLYIPLIISITLIAIKLPEVDTWLKEQHKNATLFIAIFLIVSTIINHIITVISPFGKYEKLEKNKLILLDHITSEFLSQNPFSDFHIVANIRVPKKVFFSNLEIRKSDTFFGKINHFRKSFFKKHLVTIWVSKGDTISKKLKMTTTQGVSGMAYSEGKAAIVDIPQAINDLNFNDKQKTAISGKGFVISYPLFAFDEKYRRIGTKIIGVVTLSCNKIGSEKLIRPQKNREILTKKIVEFSNICGLIL